MKKSACKFYSILRVSTTRKKLILLFQNCALKLLRSYLRQHSSSTERGGLYRDPTQTEPGSRAEIPGWTRGRPRLSPRPELRGCANAKLQPWIFPYVCHLAYHAKVRGAPCSPFVLFRWDAPPTQSKNVGAQSSAFFKMGVALSFLTHPATRPTQFSCLILWLSWTFLKKHPWGDVGREICVRFQAASFTALQRRL